MDKSELKRRVKEIEDICSGVSEQYRLKCFEILMNKLLTGAGGDSDPDRPLDKQAPNNSKLADFANVLAQNDDGIQVIAKMPGKSKSDRTGKIALLLLLGNKLTGTNDVPVSQIRQMCKKHGTFDQANFSTVLKRQTQDILLSGKGGSATASLTVPGLSKATELAKELSST